MSKNLKTEFKQTNLEQLKKLDTQIITEYTLEVITTLCKMTDNLVVQTTLLTIFFDINYLAAMFSKAHKKKQRVISANFDLLSSHIDLAELEHGVESDELVAFVESFKLVSLLSLIK